MNKKDKLFGTFIIIFVGICIVFDPVRKTLSAFAGCIVGILIKKLRNKYER